LERKKERGHMYENSDFLRQQRENMYVPVLILNILEAERQETCIVPDDIFEAEREKPHVVW
jgi:hypothetical protein